MCHLAPKTFQLPNLQDSQKDTVPGDSKHCRKVSQYCCNIQIPSPGTEVLCYGTSPTCPDILPWFPNMDPLPVSPLVLEPVTSRIPPCFCSCGSGAWNVPFLVHFHFSSVTRWEHTSLELGQRFSSFGLPEHPLWPYLSTIEVTLW